MAAENPTWGEERIANELLLKLTIQVSPRTVGKYLRQESPVRTPDPNQRWLTLVRNHAKVVVACDFLVVITAAFRTLYVFLIMEIESRRVLFHMSPATHGGMDAAAVPGSAAGRSCLRFVIHDRDRISLRRSIRVLPIWVYEFCGRRCDRRRRTPYASDWAAAFVANVSTSCFRSTNAIFK
jgi:hypothetical protein